MSDAVGKESNRKNLAGILIAIILFVYGGISIINLLIAVEHIGTYIYGNALMLFLLTGLPAIIIGLFLVVLAYRRR